ncbi:CPBP family glutamic-type intramembrane protease [Staphylococcus epidermidis]|uniref:CPBP family glutamic-type intramembrane protease n=1 Tax=Staphylococcus epidermidis TaxID=1282 RepID=UPI0037D9ABF9
MIQQLLFRHLIIHQLPKKLTYPFIYILSIVPFTYFHSTHPLSPFQPPPYFIPALLFLIPYHFTHPNLPLPIPFHIITNLIPF